MYFYSFKFYFKYSFREDIKKFNEKNGLVYKSKIRYYGQYKKEQLEKYKISSNLSKSKFVFLFSLNIRLTC